MSYVIDATPGPSMRALPSLRDRLLLAFANLASYGITTRPSLDGEITAGRALLVGQIRRDHPRATGSYVFWSQRDERRFSSAGDLRADGVLPLHHSGPETLAAITAACAEVGIEALADPSGTTAFVRDLQPVG